MSSEWPMVRLGDHVDACLGKMLDTKKNKGTPQPYLGNSNVRWGTFDLDDLSEMPFESHEEERYSLRPGDLVVCEGGEPGRCAIWTGPAGMKVQKALHRIRSTGSFDSYYLYYWFQQQAKTGRLEPHFTGTTIKHLTGKAIAALEVPLPPIAVQRSMVASLRSLDDRITLLRETNATLEAIAQALFKSWFVDFDPVRALAHGRAPEGMDEATAALFPDNFEDSEVGEVPRGWRVMPLLDACDMQGGAQPPASTFIDEPRAGYIRLLQIRDFSTDAHKTYIPVERKLKIASEDDVLLGRYGSASGDKAKDSLGRICRGLAGAYNVALMKLVPIEVGREFALQLVDDPRFYQYLQGVSSKAVQSGFSKKELGQYKVVVPPQALCAEYEEFGEMVWQRAKALNKQADVLASLRDTLLPRLISGQLRLPEAQSLLEATA